MADDVHLDTWKNELSMNLMALDFRDIDLDFSEGSLTAVEEELLDVFDESGDVDREDEGERLLVDAAAGYVGEFLLRLTGGGWRWAGDEPVLRPDPALSLPPLSARRLVGRALDERTGQVFAGTAAEWAAAAQRQRASDPGWAPRKEHTPGVDPVLVDDAEAAWIAGWLREREAAFPAWVAAFGSQTEWDFGPGTLDALEELIARFAPTVVDVVQPGDPAFVDGAKWYFGEVVRRIRGGRWVYREPVPGRPNSYNGVPYVEQPSTESTRDEPAANLTLPGTALYRFVKTGERGTLRAYYRSRGGA